MLSYSTSKVINFSDCDPAGVIFYPRAMAIAHDAVEAMIAHSALGHNAWFLSDQYAAPLRHAELDFRQPLRPRDEITLQARVEKIGNTSVTFVVDFLRDDGGLAAKVTTVHVLIEKNTGQPAEISPAARAALSADA
jgi:YbgC/YbaW family acyl-CoA thioester hydrolase